MPSEFDVKTNTVGRQCTRGDEVVNALGSLLKKMELLEKNRRKAHEFAAQDLKGHVDLVESQCSLLEEQLRHARKMLALSTTLRSSPYLEREEYASTIRSRHRSTSMSQITRSSQTNSTARLRSTSETRSEKTGNTAAERFKLNIADIPFILSKSAGPSHSLPANLQNLVSLLKKSQPGKLCSRNRHLKGPKRSRSDNNLDANIDEKELLDLVLQGEELLKQMESKRPQSRHSLKCKARWLIKHIQDKLVNQQMDQAAEYPLQQSHRRHANTASRNPTDGNRIFFRELKRIQKSLEEQL